MVKDGKLLIEEVQIKEKWGLCIVTNIWDLASVILQKMIAH